MAPMDWATCPHIIRQHLDTCQHPICRQSSNKNVPRHPNCHVIMMVRPCHVAVRTVRIGTVNSFFSCLTFRTDRYIFRSRRPFETKQIALGS